MGMNLEEHEAIQGLMPFLEKYDLGLAREFYLLAWKLDGMGSELDAAARELRETEGRMPRQPMARTAERLGRRIPDWQGQVLGLKRRVIDGAGRLLDDVRREGLSALDQGISVRGIKEDLEAVRAGLSESIAGLGASMKRTELAAQGIGAGDAAPFRIVKAYLLVCSKQAQAAVAAVEHLEGAAHSRETAGDRKPSVRNKLRELKAEASGQAAAENGQTKKEQAKKEPEAAL